MTDRLSNIQKQDSEDSVCSANKSIQGLSDSTSLQSIEIDDVIDREFGSRDNDFQDISSEEINQLIESCKTKSVAFAIRTNIEYRPINADDQPPLPGRAISFDVKEFLHVKERYNQDWWIGRKVAINAPLGFIPSPIKIEKLRNNSEGKSKSIAGALQIGRPHSTGEQMPIQPSTTILSDNRPFSEEFGLGEISIEGIEPPIQLNMDDEPSENTKQINSKQLSKTTVKEKRKMFFRKAVTLHPPYDVVPNMRPIILIGPSLKGYDVTDMMQKAVFDFLKNRYEGSITITRVCSDISQVKRKAGNTGQVMGGKGTLSIMERSAVSSKQQASDNIREAFDEIERIYELARSLNLIVLDCDTINHPAQLQKTSLAPITVYLKIASPKILQKLIKSRGKSQTKNLNVQLVVAEKLTQCPNSAFDVILDQNQLDDACTALAEYLDHYWEATHPKLTEPTESVITPTLDDGHRSTHLIPPPPIPQEMMLSRLLMTSRDNLQHPIRPTAQTRLYSPQAVRLVRPSQQWQSMGPPLHPLQIQSNFAPLVTQGLVRQLVVQPRHLAITASQLINPHRFAPPPGHPSPEVATMQMNRLQIVAPQNVRLFTLPNEIRDDKTASFHTTSGAKHISRK